VALAKAYADSLDRALSDTLAALTLSDAYAGLYLERLRLGLGSPFRLVDQVLRDTALDRRSRPRLALAILDRTRRTEAYRFDASALALMGAGASSRTPQHGARHADLIDAAIANARDPRVAELAVRLAYRVAAASGVLDGNAPGIAAHAASQSRDRIKARQDVETLFRFAQREGIDPVELVPVWRVSRRFAVERPIIEPLSADDERRAVAMLPDLVSHIQEIAEESAVPTSADSSSSAGRPRISLRAARQLAGVAALRNAPPQAPVGVIVSGFGHLVIRDANARERPALERFVARSINDESLAAELALLSSRFQRPNAEAALSALAAGVSLRVLAQERPWLAGDQGPTIDDLQVEFGLSVVTFDRTVPETWRPFYLRMFADAVRDLRRVFPEFVAAGLRVHFGESPLRERALAMHDPRTRTVYLPVATGVGVIAHELAHDLDWQAARRRYGSSGGYRTDRALRQWGDRFAGAVQQMASATSPSDAARARSDASDRPTEVFARNTDWFVSAALAREGRMNGYLSAVQDALITGYASAITPEASRDAGEAMLRVLEEITPVPSDTRDWFQGHFGRDRRLTAHEAVRRVLEAPLSSGDSRTPRSPWDVVGSSQRLLREVPAASAAWACVLDQREPRGGDAPALRAVMQYAAEARARGVLQRWAAIAERTRGPAWRNRVLGGVPWRAELAQDAEREIRDALLWSAATAINGRGATELSERTEIRVAAGRCE
jgi:hypothetical protein